MAYLTADELLDTEDGFTEWNEDAAAGSTEETLEQALAEERLAELESELEQDEHAPFCGGKTVHDYSYCGPRRF